jgi:hypothetical protein
MGATIQSKAGLAHVLKTEMNRKARLAYQAARKNGKTIVEALEAAKNTLPK